MTDNTFTHLVHGGDYNPDQWIRYPGVLDEDMRLMKLAHVNSATVGIFAWSLLEPAEGEFNFAWLDEVMDKAAANGIGIILATPSGARPPWMAQKYPEVLRVEESGIRNEYGVRHNHCLTSPLYREKVALINRKLAERYANHPALKMWHISNEYSGACHCPLCQEAFRDWLKDYYHNDLEALNEAWWGGFWSHRFTDWSQISSPKFRGENHVPALKLCWNRFVTDSHISFMKNEIAPLRELTPHIPVTTNMMNMYDGINYRKMAKELDIVSWDNYPQWNQGDDTALAEEVGFVHDVFRTMGGGKPFFMMESTPANVNWKDVNKLPAPGMQALSSMQAVAHGADSVQYFQWRKSRGGHEKFHGAVVDHVGNENTRVFREVSRLGEQLEKLDAVKGGRCQSKIAVICDWENMWAIKYYCGYNNKRRDYVKECVKWYAPFHRRGYSVDVIGADDDFSPYDLIIAPYLYSIKSGVGQRLADFVAAGGTLAATYLTAITDENDLCYLGGWPGDGLRKVFGIRNEETDSLLPTAPGKAEFGGKAYSVDHVCDIIYAEGAEVLGTYQSDFYKGLPAVTANTFGKGTAYYAAFRNDGDFADDFCAGLLQKTGIAPDCPITFERGVSLRKRGEVIFLMNFGDAPKSVTLDKPYTDLLTGNTLSGSLTLPAKGYFVIK